MVVVSSTVSEPLEGIILQSPSTKLIVNNDEMGTGTLYITENNVMWHGGNSPANGAPLNISLMYPSISLHAVQRNPTPALYMVLNYELRLPGLNQQSGSGDANEDDDDDEFDADDQPITQLRFVPANENDLAGMYAAMTQGQTLHPDPADEIDDDPYMDGEDDDGDEEFEDAEETTAAPDDAAARLRNMQIENSNGNQHYDDAEEEIGE